nr:excalibur calcium-binding domain-containing protein [Bacillus sp. J33]
MTAIFLIGFLIFLFSLIYLAFHFIRKLKDRSRTLSKKIFYPSFIGGLLLFIIGGSYMDTGVQAQLDEALADNEKLTAEVKTLKEDVKELQGSNEELTKEKEKLDKDLKEVSAKVAAAEKAEKELSDQKAAFDKEKEGLTKQISDLESKNKALDNEVSSLKGQLASKNTTSTTASSNTSGSSNASTSSNSDQNSATTTSGGSENFANCTELRKVYPNGVPSSHAAYQSKMDRDKDNYACER